MPVDLTTSYLGLTLAHPIVPSASPLTGDLYTLRSLEEAGAPAVVLPSLFEEQIVYESAQLADLIETTGGGFGEATEGYFPELDDYNTGPESYLQLVERASVSLDIPVIASLNGASTGGWTRYARLIEDAGARALELNVYVIASDPALTTDAIERQYLELVQAVRQAISIPLAVKVGPFFSAFGNMAGRLVEAGADALVLFNRFYQPDLDIEDLTVAPNLVLSSSDDIRLPLRWIAMLYGRIMTQFAGTSGVHSADDVVKLLMVGADVTMTTAALLKKGPGHLAELVSGLRTWMDEHDYASVDQMRGSMSQVAAPDPAAFERANYMKSLVTYAP